MAARTPSGTSDRKPAPVRHRAGQARSLRRRVLLSLAVLAVILVSLVAMIVSRSRQTPIGDEPATSGLRPTEVQAPPPPPLPESPFLNVQHASYVGSEVCLQCHADEHASYRRTGMGRSLAELDVDKEPPPGVVVHPPSSRKYEIYYEDGQMHHRELLFKGDREAAPVVFGDYTIPYVIGSGRHSRSYLLEIDDFMVESPVTWYTSKQAWDMSPGYDSKHQEGFQRAVNEGCLICHAGRVEVRDGSFHRTEIQEHWIGCERCHGPGSLHVDRHNGNPLEFTEAQLQDGPIDRTIVNQAHLGRELSESICAQCHLRSASNIFLRGRKIDDFRPGLPLSAFRTDYRLDQPNTPLRVVGHVEQLQLSRCYQQSQMTCTTCHNPHGFPEPQERLTFYRNACLQCHDVDGCGLQEPERRKISAEDNCIQCHMPKSDTEIPHLAFTHHRIGLHAEEAESSKPPAVAGTLVPLSESPQLSELDRQRSLGLAYVELSQQEQGIAHQEIYQQRAAQLLRSAWEGGVRDADTASNLAHLALLFGEPGVPQYAYHALSQSDLSGRTRVNALMALAAYYERAGQDAAAAEMLRQVTQLRRFSGDWILLGQCEQRLGNHRAALAALEKALEIHPLDTDLRSWLVDYYEQQGSARADWHRQRLPDPQDSASR